MPLDPSIPLGVQPPPSPLASIGPIVNTAQGLLSLRQNQMQLNANQAISQAYSQSINPDGSVDFNKLQGLAAQNGAGAFLPQFMGQIAQQRNAQQQYDVSKLDMALKQQQNIRGLIGSLAVDPELGRADMSQKIASQISNAVQTGALPLDQGINEIKSIPSDPQAQAGWIQNHLINSLSGEAKMQALMPQNVAVPTGAGTALLNRNPLTGQTTPGTFVQNALSPAELAAPKNIIGPNGEQRQVTTAQWLAMQNSGGAAAGGQFNGRYPGNAAQSAPGIQTGLSPSESAAAEVTGGGSAKQLVADQSSVNGSAGRIFQLSQALGALQNATTGKGSENLNNIRSYLTTSGAGSLLGVDPNKIANYDEANKYLTQYALNQAGQFGESTDHKLATTLSGNASTSISNLAAQDVVKANIGLERMKQAQVAAFNNSGLSPAQYQKFSSEWNRQVDPRVFIVDQMDANARTKLRDSMSPQQRQQFSTQYNNALANGWVGKVGQ